MFGKPYLTVQGETIARLDTVRVMLNGVSLAHLPGHVAELLGAGWHYSARRRHLRHLLSGATATVHGGPAGTAVEFGGETLRAMSEGEELALCVAGMFGPAGGVTVPRLDWASQVEWDGDPAAVSAWRNRALAAGFEVPEKGDRLPAFVGTPDMMTHYLKCVEYRRVRGPNGKERCLVDTWVWRCYPAETVGSEDSPGLRYLRIECQERLGSRVFCGCFSPTTRTVAALGVREAAVDTLEVAAPVDSATMQLARGLSLLAAHVPPAAVADVRRLLEKLSRLTQAPFGGARDRLVERERAVSVAVVEEEGA